MSAVNESGMASQSFIEHTEMCVLCLGCETACPAGVPFGELMEQTREALVSVKPGLKRSGAKTVWTKMATNRVLDVESAQTLEIQLRFAGVGSAIGSCCAGTTFGFCSQGKNT